MMKTNAQLGLLLAVAGGVALGTAIALERRKARRHVMKQERKQDLQAWEGEGGSLSVAKQAS